MSNIIDSIQLSGSSYDVRDKSATTVVEITQSEYDNLPSSAKTSNILYIITDGSVDYITSAQCQTQIDNSISGKQDTLSAGTGIDITDNVISATGGGGKAIEAGRGISVTTGETADTVSFNLPISAGTGTNSIIIGFSGNTATGNNSVAVGSNSHATKNGAFAEGGNTTASGYYSHAEGLWTIANNSGEHASGQYNNSVSDSSTFGDSGNTLFSVGNGTSDSARHNAFEIRQNGDIYLTSGGTDIKLQDHLGGGGGITSGEVQSMIDESISGKTDESAFTAHTADTTIHVSSSEKNTWNNKSDFSGSYNDLTDKPTIPTSVSQLTNDSGYITSSALDGYATEAYVTAATNDMATKTWVGQQGYLTQHQDISGKQDISGMTAYTETSAFTAHTADTTVHVTAQDKTNWNNKSDFSGSYNDLTNKLSAGTNVTIIDNVISAEGGGSITIDPSLDASSTNPVANSAITNAINGKLQSVDFAATNWAGTGTTSLRKTVNGSTYTNYAFVASINQKPILASNYQHVNKFSLVETSAITTSVTSSSTDAQVPSAKAVYDIVGNIETLLSQI